MDNMGRGVLGPDDDDNVQAMEIGAGDERGTTPEQILQRSEVCSWCVCFGKSEHTCSEQGRTLPFGCKVVPKERSREKREVSLSQICGGKIPRYLGTYLGTFSKKARNGDGVRFVFTFTGVGWRLLLPPDALTSTPSTHLMRKSSTESLQMSTPSARGFFSID